MNIDNISKIVKSLEKGYETSERLLWKRLQARRLSGLRFKRREIIGNSMVHFVCHDEKIVIELCDPGRDPEKDNFLVSQGYKVLAFSNANIEQDIERVLKTIQVNCTSGKPAAENQAC